MRVRHDYLRELRLRFGKTQSEIAQEVGVDIRTYRKYETGEIGWVGDKALRASQYEFLRNLAAYYDLQGGLDEFLGASEPPPGPMPAVPAALPTSGRFVPIRYVHRHGEEARARRLLERAGTPVVVHAPERFGATRFLGYLLHNMGEAADARTLVIRVNLARLWTTAATLGQPLLLLLGEHILSRACADKQLAEERSKLVRSLPTTERGKLSWLLERYVLPLADRIHLLIEHADALVGQAAQTDLFALLRCWAEAKDHELWNRLRILLSTSTEPSMLESRGQSSFFDLTAPIRLEEFDRHQLQQMASLEGMLNPEAIDKLMYWVGGNPYLARLALQAAFERDQELTQLLDDASVRRSLFSHHLLYMRHAVEGRRGLIEVVTSILNTGRAHVGVEEFCFLYKKGLLVERESGVVSLRCRLYEQYFRESFKLAGLAETPAGLPE